MDGAYNICGAASPAIDAMIAALLAAERHEDFVAAVRALDRVLLSGFYIVPSVLCARAMDRLFRPARPSRKNAACSASIRMRGGARARERG